MDRSDFGGWGANLSDEDFARALTALAFLYEFYGFPLDDIPAEAPERLKHWPDAFNDIAIHYSLFRYLVVQAIPRPDPGKCAELWKTLTRGSNIRIRIEDGPPWPENWPIWFAEQLSRTGIASVYVRVDEPDAPVTWKFPLRIGWFDDTPSRAMKRHLDAVRREHKVVSRLWSLVKLTRDQVECDILLMPQSMPSAVARLLELQTRVEADLVIVMGARHGSDAQRWRLTQLLRHTVECSAVAMLPLPEGARAPWLHRLVKTISQNARIDEAILSATRRTASEENLPQPQHVLVSSQRFVENSRLQVHMENLVGRMEDSRIRDRSIVLSEQSALVRRLGIEPGPTSLDHVRAMLTKEGLDTVFFRFEQDGASEIVNLDQKIGQLERRFASRAVEEREAPRFIQARVQRLSAEERPASSARSFVPGESYGVDVRIGRPAANWPLFVEREFPTEELPRGLDEYRLDVTFAPLVATASEEAPLEAIRAQSRQVVLPARGDSTTCRFQLFVPGGARAVQARIILSFRGRVLQTAILKGSVGEKERDTIELIPEFAVELKTTLLSGRRPFDAAIVLNHTAGDRPGITAITAITPERAAFNTARDLDKLTAWFANKLTEIAYERKAYEGGLGSPKAVELLRLLARHGSMLRSELKKALGFDPQTLGDRIQVLTAHPDARLCLELVYDFESPEENAPLCKYAADSLRRGECDGRCPTGEHKSEVVCPLGFWGTNKVLERQATERPRDGKDLEFRTGATAREGLRIFECALAAGSQRVVRTVPNGMQAIVDQLVAAIPGLQSQQCLQDAWDRWRLAIQANPCSLLLVTCHTEEIQGGIIQKMEIGNDSWLAADHINKSYVKHADSSQPLLLLLGCETGAPKVSLLSLVSKFHDAGAKIVVSTTSSIHASHAVPIAIAFVKALHALCSRHSGRLGEVMRDLRRVALADGLPAVLCLTAFGDADYVLNKVTQPKASAAAEAVLVPAPQS